MIGFDIRELEVWAGKKQLLEIDRLHIGGGEWVGLVGPNGAGKTTLLNAIGGQQPYLGNINTFGPDPCRARGERKVYQPKLISMVPQRPQLPEGMKVFDYVLLGRTPHVPYFRTETLSDIATVRQCLELVNVDSMWDRELRTLSGGEQQRVVLARCLTQETPVLLLDEPSSSLDIASTSQIFELLDGLRKLLNKTVVTALHDLNQAVRFCSQLVLLNRGQMVAAGHPGEVITTDSIREAYGVEVEILFDQHDELVITPLRNRERRTVGVS